MKKTVFFIALCAFFCTIRTVVSQTYGVNNSEFFIPQNAMMQRVEKLPPINVPKRGLPSAVRSNTATDKNKQTAQLATKQTQPRKILRYQAIDGRFVPIYAPIEETAQNDNNSEDTPESSGANSVLADSETDNNQAIENQILPDEQEAEQNNINADPLPTAKIPTAVVQNGLPNYRNRYAQYLTDLQTFGQTKNFTQNADLNNALNKMDSDNEILIFKK